MNGERIVWKNEETTTKLNHHEIIVYEDSEFQEIGEIKIVHEMSNLTFWSRRHM